ncbi:MAG: hypothetical protein ACR2O4_05780 [Hyphomicrobiaceae bacterium]
MRAPLVQPLSEALASRKQDDIRTALKELATTRSFVVPKDPTAGRRPVRSAYDLRFSDGQLQRRATDLFKTIEREAWWLNARGSADRAQRIPLSELAAAIRNLLALARAFPEWEGPSRKLARQTGDYVIKVSEALELPAAALAPFDPNQPARPFLRGALRKQLKSCKALQRAIRNGWFVSPVTPEMHYRETSLVGEAMIRLARDTGEQRFLDWTRDASRWLTSRPIAADFTANAMVAGFDAELFILTAEKKYLERAVDWATFGVLPAFEDLFVSRLSLEDLAMMTRGLVHLSTAVATSPLGTLDEGQVKEIYKVTRQAHAVLQQRAVHKRRLQFPAQLIEIAIDLERAQLAGGRLPDPEPGALRYALAHGADRLQRYIEMRGAAKGRLLEKLMMRGWSGAFRTATNVEAAIDRTVEKK